MTVNTPSPLLLWTFTLLSLLVAAALPVGVHVALRRVGPAEHAGRSALAAGAAVAGWLGVTYALAASGWLAFGRLPPPLALLFGLILVMAVALGASRLGEKLALGLPLVALVGVHAFRLPLELIMHRAYEEGVMPVQMSYSGLNYDVLTGLGAIVVALLLLAGRMPLSGVRLWNWVGFLLLMNILVVAWLSTPTPLRVFSNEPANVWITHAPFVWLPAVLVFTALLGHILVFRRLAMERSTAWAGVDVAAAVGGARAAPARPVH